MLLPTQESKATRTDDIFAQVYGTIISACTQDADADTAQNNRLGPLTTGRRYLVYCHNGTGSGVACECRVGTVTVDASSSVGTTLFAGEKMIMNFPSGNAYISCVPFVDNQFYDVCPLD